MADTQPTSNRIKAVNPSLDGNATTFLTEDIAVGATTLNILDKKGFLKAEHYADTYFYVLIGLYGQEKSEIVKVTADDTVNQSLTCEATKYSHTSSEQITYIPYNKVQLFGSTTSGGTKTSILTSLIDASKQYTDLYYEGATYSF